MAPKIDYTSRLSLFGICFLVFTLFYFINGFFSSMVTLIGTFTMLSTIAWQTMMFIKFNLLNRFLFKRIDAKNKSVFITGCDTGFGHLTALRLNEYGFKVFAGCLSSDSEGAKSLVTKASNKSRMIVVQVNVNNEDEIDACLSQVKESIKLSNGVEQFWAVINNAGVSAPGPVEWGEFNRHFRSVMETNTLSQVLITRKFLPLLRKSHGRVICVASIAGRITSEFLASYSMSKHAIVAFCDSLREEVERFGVKVVTIEPYFYRTEIVKPEIIDGGYQKAYEETNQEIRIAYGVEKELKKLAIHSILNLPLIGASNNLDQVVGDIESAVVDDEPKLRYTPIPYIMRGGVLLAQIIPKYFVQQTHLKDFQRMYKAYSQQKKNK